MVLCIAGRLVRAGQAEDPGQTTRIALGSTSGEAGTTVVVPIYLAPADKTRIGSLTLKLRFVSKNLNFSQLQKGVAAEAGNVELRTRIQERKNEQGLEISDLIIEALPGATDSPPNGIPSGLLAYLNFQIDAEAGNASITLRTSAEATELGTNRPLENLLFTEGRVETLAAGSMPVAICFFFTH